MSQVCTTTARHDFFPAILCYRSSNGHCLWHHCTPRCFQDKTVKGADVPLSFMCGLNVVSCLIKDWGILHLRIGTFYLDKLEKIILYTAYNQKVGICYTKRQH